MPSPIIGHTHVAWLAPAHTTDLHWVPQDLLTRHKQLIARFTAEHYTQVTTAC